MLRLWYLIMVTDSFVCIFWVKGSREQNKNNENVSENKTKKDENNANGEEKENSIPNSDSMKKKNP